MTITTYIAAYLGAGFLMLAWTAWSDRASLREGFWVSLLWPLTLVLLVWVLAGAILGRCGFRCHVGQPRVPRWDAGRAHVYGEPRAGFWVSCPRWVVGVWWVKP